MTNNLPVNLKNNKNKLIYADLTYQIRKGLFNVYNGLGFGHKENIYQNALEKEFGELKIPFRKEEGLKISFKDQVVGLYKPDFIIADKVILEIKSTALGSKVFEKQLLYYLKSTGFKLGLLANFGQERLYVKRLIWTNRQESRSNNPRKSLMDPRES